LAQPPQVEPLLVFQVVGAEREPGRLEPPDAEEFLRVGVQIACALFLAALTNQLQIIAVLELAVGPLLVGALIPLRQGLNVLI
jgi:hypothetical protein